MNVNFVEILKKNHLKITLQRIAILEALYQIPLHPTVENIREKLTEQYPTISLTTIYNTLETFCQHGLVKKIKTDQDKVRYDRITEPHHHIYCRECDHVSDFFDPRLDEILRQYFNDHPIKGWKITDITLQISGYHNKNKN
ncbi:MAG TPA: transcriptional repressor [Salinivirgaceae bacterium]|nr:transcriptional repressor [Salinivirgaceae bacterium]